MTSPSVTSKPPGPGRGFTLVELMVVLALIGLLAAIAGPSVMRTIERADAREVARETASMLRFARDQAMTRGEVVMARVQTGAAAADGSNGRVDLYRTPDNATSCLQANPASLGPAQQVRSLTVASLSGDMELLGADPAGTSWLCFAPDGRVLDADAAIIESDLCGALNKNARFFLAKPGTPMINPVLGVDMSTCATVAANNAAQATAAQKQKNARDLDNFWVIDVPFNGNIKAMQ